MNKLLFLFGLCILISVGLVIADEKQIGGFEEAWNFSSVETIHNVFVKEDFVYVAFSSGVKKFEVDTGLEVWDIDLSSTRDVFVDDEDNIYILRSEQIRKYDSNYDFVWSRNTWSGGEAAQVVVNDYVYVIFNREGTGETGTNALVFLYSKSTGELLIIHSWVNTRKYSDLVYCSRYYASGDYGILYGQSGYSSSSTIKNLSSVACSDDFYFLSKDKDVFKFFSPGNMSWSYSSDFNVTRIRYFNGLLALITEEGGVFLLTDEGEEVLSFQSMLDFEKLTFNDNKIFVSSNDTFLKLDYPSFLVFPGEDYFISRDVVIEFDVLNLKNESVDRIDVFLDDVFLKSLDITDNLSFNANLSSGEYNYTVKIISEDTWVSDTYLFNVELHGCTDPDALNYDEEAEVDDDSCEYPTPGGGGGGGWADTFVEEEVEEDDDVVVTDTSAPLFAIGGGEGEIDTMWLIIGLVLIVLLIGYFLSRRKSKKSRRRRR